MKKQFKIILCLTLIAATLSGCGFFKGKDSASSSAESTSVSSGETSSAIVPENNVQANNDAVAGGIQRGTWTENVYTNNYAGLRFTNPAGWTATTDEELSKLMGLSVETMENAAEFQNAMSTQATVYDMMTVDPATNSTVIVMYDNIMLKTGSNETTAEEYLNSVADMLADMDSGVEYQVGEIGEREICGNAYKALTTSDASTGAPMTQKYYVRKNGDYMITVIITAAGTTNFEDIIACFKN